jgi:hypothetical protein
LWLLLLLRMCSHLGQGPKDKKHVHDDKVALGRNYDRI